MYKYVVYMISFLTPLEQIFTSICIHVVVSLKKLKMISVNTLKPHYYCFKCNYTHTGFEMQFYTDSRVNGLSRTSGFFYYITVKNKSVCSILTRKSNLSNNVNSWII